MNATAVIGASYGDEGKGQIVSAIAQQYGRNCMVVRFNSSAQAGHTVQVDGKRHVFHHFGSGTLTEASTYLSENFVCHPMLYRKERVLLAAPTVYASRDSLVTTPYDVMLNQALESQRGDSRHGSCGIGFGETIERSFNENYAIRVGEKNLRAKLELIKNEYVPLRQAALGVIIPDSLLHDYGIMSSFVEDFDFMTGDVVDLPRMLPSQVIFEGAQGLGLDQDYGHFPYVTRSNTGLKNAVDIASRMGIESLDAIYVTRSYLTRHGAGPMESEDPSLSYQDATNVTNDYQGSLRFGALDVDAMQARIDADVRMHGELLNSVQIAVTCLDQCESLVHGDIYSYGPSADDVEF